MLQVKILKQNCIIDFHFFFFLERAEGGLSRLSPRASSEGSGSFEDSGHVSGASTENTPEHRRTDSTFSQLSVPSSTLSTVTDVSTQGYRQVTYANILLTVTDVNTRTTSELQFKVSTLSSPCGQCKVSSKK